MQSHEQENQNGSDAGSGLNLLMFVVQSYAISVEVFLHRRLGERYLGIHALFALFLIPIHAVCWERHDPMWLTRFWFIYFLACIIQRIGILSRYVRGDVTHSRYTGWPWLLTGNRKWTELKFKLQFEPALVCLIGFAVFAANKPFGSYLIMAGISLFIKNAAYRIGERQRMLNMNDTIMEQRRRSQDFHNRFQ